MLDSGSGLHNLGLAKIYILFVDVETKLIGALDEVRIRSIIPKFIKTHALSNRWPTAIALAIIG